MPLQRREGGCWITAPNNDERELLDGSLQDAKYRVKAENEVCLFNDKEKVVAG